MVAWLYAAPCVFTNVVSFQMYGLVLSAMLVLMKLYQFTVFVYDQFASTRTSLRRALGTTSSLAFRSLSTPSLQRPMRSTKPRTPAQLSASSTTWISTILLSVCLGWVASAYPGHSFTLTASFAQTSSFSSFLSILDSFHIIAALKMAYFTHEQLIPLLLANEAYTLPPALLQHVMEGMLFNDELEELSDKINPQWVSDNLPKLPKRDELQFWMVLGEKAMESFEKSEFQQLPPQKVSGAFNPNLSSWRASSSFAKAVNFWAWTACRAPQLLKEAAYVISFKITVSRFMQQHKALQLGDSVSLEFQGADCQLCFWGKPASEEQPYFGSLHIELGNLWVRLAPFEKMPQLYDHASFDWGTASSEHHLAASWTQDLQQHATVYQQLTAKLGPNHPMAKLIQKELDKDVEEPPFKRLRTSAARASFWQETAKSFHRTLGEVVQRVSSLPLTRKKHQQLCRQKRHLCLCQLPPQQFRHQHQPQDQWMAAWPACRVVTATFRYT